MNDVVKHENGQTSAAKQAQASGRRPGARTQAILGTLLVAATGLRQPDGLDDRPLRRGAGEGMPCAGAAETIASGDLTQRIDSARRDELGDLLRSVEATWTT